MIHSLTKVFLSLFFTIITLQSLSAQSAFYELRVYHCHPGKLDNLIARFQNHTTKIFEKHGMTNIAYWTVEEKPDQLYYILSYPSLEDRDKAWKAFGSDPEWKEVQTNSEKDGKIVAKVESTYLSLETELNKKIKLTANEPNRLFELRTYYSPQGKYQALVNRFKNHTLKLFKKHDIQNIAYFKTIEKGNLQPKLLYVVAHKSKDEATKNWDEFRNDPTWIAAKTASELDGKIVDKVTNVFLKPLPFSKLK